MPPPAPTSSTHPAPSDFIQPIDRLKGPDFHPDPDPAPVLTSPNGIILPGETNNKRDNETKTDSANSTYRVPRAHAVAPQNNHNNSLRSQPRNYTQPPQSLPQKARNSTKPSDSHLLEDNANGVKAYEEEAADKSEDQPAEEEEEEDESDGGRTAEADGDAEAEPDGDGDGGDTTDEQNETEEDDPQRLHPQHHQHYPHMQHGVIHHPNEVNSGDESGEVDEEDDEEDDDVEDDEDDNDMDDSPRENRMLTFADEHGMQLCDYNFYAPETSSNSPSKAENERAGGTDKSDKGQANKNGAASADKSMNAPVSCTRCLIM